MPRNDNNPPLSPALSSPVDAHGHAALLLIESLIHGLCDKAILSAHEAVEVVESAVHVQFDHAEAADGGGAPMWRAHELLQSIAASFRIDADGTPPKPRLVT